MPANRKKPPRPIDPPEIEEAFLSDVIPPDFVRDYARYENLALSGRTIAGQTVKSTEFHGSRFTRLNAQETRFVALRLLDIRFQGCDLANVDWFKVVAIRVEVIECRMTGLQAAEGEFQDVVFRECKADLAHFASATFKFVRFEKCDLTGASFQEADLSGVVFVECNLTQCDFSGAKLVGTDLRGSKIEGLRVGPKDLRGTIVDPRQAVTLVQLLGVEVDVEA